MTLDIMNYPVGRVAEFCDVNRSTVGRWISEGRLEAFRLPSGHLRVARRSLLDFMEQYHMALPSELRNKSKNVFVLTADPDLVDFLRRGSLSEAESHFNFIVDSDPLEAAFVLGRSKPELLVVDLRISDLNVAELAQLIAVREELSHMASWVFGGYDKEEIGQLPKLFGRIHGKPWQIDVIKEKFKEIL